MPVVGSRDERENGLTRLLIVLGRAQCCDGRTIKCGQIDTAFGRAAPRQIRVRFFKLVLQQGIVSLPTSTVEAGDLFV